MRRVRCYECGKRYDFDVDDFCPKCGAFNQPDRTSRIGADGSVTMKMNYKPGTMPFLCHSELEAVRK